MSEDKHHDGINNTDGRKPLLASPDQEVAPSLKSSASNNGDNNNSNAERNQSFSTFFSIRTITFVLLLSNIFFPSALQRWSGWQTAEKVKEPKHVDTCTAAPSVSWSSVHTLATNQYKSLQVGHEITDRLQVHDGLVQVQVNDQVSKPTVRFDLKLTDARKLDLIQIKQITQNDSIAILIDADATAESPSCLVLDILVELPTPTALDELIIKTSESAIDIDDGIHFSKSIKLETTNGNITLGENTTGNVIELNTHAGHIRCSTQESPAITQIIARSTTGQIDFEYTGIPSSAKALVDQQREVLVNLTTVSGRIDARMCKVDSLVYDVYRRFLSSFGRGGGSHDEINKYLDMLNHTISEGPSLFDWSVHKSAVWGSADNSTVHLVAKSTAKHTTTNISFGCCKLNTKKKQNQ